MLISQCLYSERNLKTTAIMQNVTVSQLSFLISVCRVTSYQSIMTLYVILWQLFTLRLACFHGNMVLACCDVSTPEKTLALIFEQLTLQYEQQNAGSRPGLTVQNIHQIRSELTS